MYIKSLLELEKYSAGVQNF